MRTNVNIKKSSVTIILFLFVLMSSFLKNEASATDHANADYIIIVHDSLARNALQQLVSHKVSQGYSVYVDTISDGTSNSSIKDLLQEAYYQGSFMPQYVLLVGSASFDTTTGDSLADAQKGNFIPTYYITDYFGYRTAIDQWYAEVDTLAGEAYLTPQIHIGRLPVESNDELQVYVDKLIFYDSDTCSYSWKDNLLFLSGDKNRGPFPDYPSPAMVNTETQKLITDYAPDEMVKQILYYSDFENDQERRDTAVNLIDEGLLILNGLGTGSDVGNLVYFLDRFGSDADFDANVHLSNSNKYPLVIGASCNLGQFDMSISDTIGNIYNGINKNLLFAPNKGAIAFLGPAGFSGELGNFNFVEKLFTNIFQNRIFDLGTLTTSTKLYSALYGYGDPTTCRSYTLLGDPSIDLSVNSDLQVPFSQSGFEITDPVCHQNKVLTQQYVSNQVAKVELRSDYYFPGNQMRFFKVGGSDDLILDSYCYWILYDINVPIDSNTRFLSFFLSVEDSPGDFGHISIDGRTSDGLYLRNLSSNGYIRDQYGQRIHPAFHTCTDIGRWKFFAFDLSAYYGIVLDKLLVGYDDNSPDERGYFCAYIDMLKISGSWGCAPTVSNIFMASPIYVNNYYSVSVMATDEDTLSFGDSLSYDWWLTGGTPSNPAGYITGSGPLVTYHAPSSPIDNVTIHVSVSDKGGNVVSRSKTFNVVEQSPPPGCPYVYVWNGQVFINDNVILTASEDKLADKSKIVDYCVLSDLVAASRDRYEIEISEFENEISKIDYLRLWALDYPYGENIGITPQGRVWIYSKDFPPVACLDQEGIDHLEEVVCKDGKFFSTRSPGHLIVDFGKVSQFHPFKTVEELGTGGGSGIDPPPKSPNKITPFVGVESGNNIVYIDVVGADGSWQNVEKVYARTSTRIPTLVELADYVKQNEDFKIRISWTRSYCTDYIGYYQFENEKITITDMPLLSAEHSDTGEIASLVNNTDGKEAVLSPNQKIRLSFSSLPDDPSKRRRFVLIAKGFYETIGKETSGYPGVEETPSILEVSQNSPNPFNPNTTICYALPQEIDVKLEIYNILGQRVRVLVDEHQEAGHKTMIWDGKDDDGRNVSSGIYFYRLSGQGYSISKKMVLIR